MESISSVQVYIDLQADPLPEDPHFQERLHPHHPQLRCWNPPPHPPLLPKQGRPFELFRKNLQSWLTLQVVEGPCMVEGGARRCLWGKEERGDIMGSLLFRAYLVTSEILLR